MKHQNLATHVVVAIVAAILTGLLSGCAVDPAPMIEGEQAKAAEFADVVEFSRKLAEQALTDDAKLRATTWLNARVDAYSAVSRASLEWLDSVAEIDVEAVWPTVRGVLIDTGVIDPTGGDGR